MSREQHSVTLSAETWTWAQEQSGLTNPAPWIRELVTEQRVATATRQAQQHTKTARWDKGTLIKVGWERKCYYCQGWMDEGDTAILFTPGSGSSRKAVAHPEHHKQEES